MSLIKCPRCELNYMLDTDKMCSVCRREVRGESEQYEIVELCSECGENPVVPGQELCAYCLKELAHSDPDAQSEEAAANGATNIGIDAVSTMDEIDIGDDVDDDEFDDDEFDDEEDEDEDEDEKDDEEE